MCATSWIRGYAVALLVAGVVAVGSTNALAAATPAALAPPAVGAQPVAGNVAVPAGTTLEGSDVTVAGQQVFGNVAVPAGTTLEGSVVMVAGKVEVDGTLDGSVALAAGQVAVGPAGVIRGDVALGLGQLAVRPGGQISGTVSVGGTQAQGLACPTAGATCTLAGVSASRALDGHVSGQALWGWADAMKPWHGATWPHPLAAHWWRWLRIGFSVLGWLGTLALALPVAALWPRALGGVSGQIERDPGRTALVGLAGLVLAVPTLALVAITIIGIPVAFVAALGLACAWFLGYVAVVALIGDRTLALARSGGAGLLWSIVAGSVLVGLAEWVPVVGGLVWLAVACVGVGAVLLTRFGTGGPWLRGGNPAGTNAAGAETTPPPV